MFILTYASKLEVRVECSILRSGLRPNRSRGGILFLALLHWRHAIVVRTNSGLRAKISRTPTRKRDPHFQNSKNSHQNFRLAWFILLFENSWLVSFPSFCFCDADMNPNRKSIGYRPHHLLNPPEIDQQSTRYRPQNDWKYRPEHQNGGPLLVSSGC